MAQAFLGANPGTVVKDVLEPELLDNPTLGASITDPAWVEVNFPALVAVVAELGTIDDTVTALDIEVVGADEDDDTGQVSYGRFAAIAGTDDNQERVLVAQAFKPLMAVLVTYAGTGSGDVRVAVRPVDYWQGNTRTA